MDSRRLYMALLVALLAMRTVAAPASAELTLLTEGSVLALSEHGVDGSGSLPHPCAESEAAPDPSLQRVTPPSAPRPFAEIIDAASLRYGVDPAVVSALIQLESAYNPDAVSPRGAVGLMQLMPATVREYAVTDPYDPTANIDAGTKHLRLLLDRYDDLDSALAAYNAGDGPVRKFGGVPPYPETRRYVSRILEMVGTQNR